jgi:hypothetical protein
MPVNSKLQLGRPNVRDVAWLQVGRYLAYFSYLRVGLSRGTTATGPEVTRAPARCAVAAQIGQRSGAALSSRCSIESVPIVSTRRSLVSRHPS